MKEKLRSNVKRVACSVAVGGANSLFGGGGGMLAVPLLTALGMKEKQAHATALLIVLPVSACSFLFYFLNGTYDFAVLIPAALGVTAGGALGATLLQKLPVKAVQIVFMILQFIAGVWLFVCR